MTDGLSREGFDIDLSVGVAREEAFAYVLRGATVEHKRDFKAAETGNLFIEYQQKGRPSGIAVTTADYWAFEFAEEHWLIVPTDSLRSLARHIWKFYPERRRAGGDFNQFMGVLIPINWLTLRQLGGTL